jgi:hypothetical protein
MSTIPPDTRAALRAMRQETNKTFKELGDQFGISTSAAWMIVNRGQRYKKGTLSAADERYTECWPSRTRKPPPVPNAMPSISLARLMAGR